jgi:hypothetical protein
MSTTKPILLAGVVGVIVVGLALGLAISSTPGTTIGTNVSDSNLPGYSIYSSAGLQCSFPTYLVNLANAVQNNPSFIKAENSKVFRLAYGYNQTQSASIGNNTSPQEQETNLAYFSLVNSSVVPTCNQQASEVRYVLFVSVPMSSNGSYNISALTAYSELYEPNSTLA